VAENEGLGSNAKVVDAKVEQARKRRSGELILSTGYPFNSLFSSRFLSSSFILGHTHISPNLSAFQSPLPASAPTFVLVHSSIYRYASYGAENIFRGSKLWRGVLRPASASKPCPRRTRLLLLRCVAKRRE